MSAAFDHDDFVPPRQEQPTCERCGRALLSVCKRQSGEQLCDGCDAAMTSGEIKQDGWEP